MITNPRVGDIIKFSESGRKNYVGDYWSGYNLELRKESATILKFRIIKVEQTNPNGLAYAAGFRLRFNVVSLDNGLSSNYHENSFKLFDYVEKFQKLHNHPLTDKFR